MWIVLRLIIGAIFVTSGMGKLLSPYQNFQYVIQAYQAIPSSWEVGVAQILPWFELLAGVSVFLGFWTAWGLRLAMCLFAAFITVVGQALIRHLPLEDCGCFGGLIHFKPQVVILMDSTGLLVTAFLFMNLPKTKILSLDAHFDKI